MRSGCWVNKTLWRQWIWGRWYRSTEKRWILTSETSVCALFTEQTKRPRSRSSFSKCFADQTALGPDNLIFFFFIFNINVGNWADEQRSYQIRWRILLDQLRVEIHLLHDHWLNTTHIFRTKLERKINRILLNNKINNMRCPNMYTCFIQVHIIFHMLTNSPAVQPPERLKPNTLTLWLKRFHFIIMMNGGIGLYKNNSYIPNDLMSSLWLNQYRWSFVYKQKDHTGCCVESPVSAAWTRMDGWARLPDRCADQHRWAASSSAGPQTPAGPLSLPAGRSRPCSTPSSPGIQNKAKLTQFRITQVFFNHLAYISSHDSLRTRAVIKWISVSKAKWHTLLAYLPSLDQSSFLNFFVPSLT